MEVSNFNNDVILAANCRGDVDKFCKNIEPGVRGCSACYVTYGVSVRGAAFDCGRCSVTCTRTAGHAAWGPVDLPAGQFSAVVCTPAVTNSCC
jgi:hypothetical protein